jgi:hypothetical protein
MDHAKQFFADQDGLVYEYANGCWFKVECRVVEVSLERPAGMKYSLALFDPDDRCLVRYDNSHAVHIHGRGSSVAYDHWHRFSNGTLVPYDFKDVETLLKDFYNAIDKFVNP